MRVLERFGPLTDVDGIAQVPIDLRPAVVTSINRPGARFTVEHDRYAVPVVTDE